jgi:hypothetical protein
MTDIITNLDGGPDGGDTNPPDLDEVKLPTIGVTLYLPAGLTFGQFASALLGYLNGNMAGITTVIGRTLSITATGVIVGALATIATEVLLYGVISYLDAKEEKTETELALLAAMNEKYNELLGITGGSIVDDTITTLDENATSGAISVVGGTEIGTEDELYIDTEGAIATIEEITVTGTPINNGIDIFVGVPAPDTGIALDITPAGIIEIDLATDALGISTGRS